jgi:Tfp pilus assembly protein PilF
VRKLTVLIVIKILLWNLWSVILLEAKLLEDTSAYKNAVTWLADNDLSQDAQRAPLYYFLLGMGYRGEGDAENAKQVFSKVVSISRDSELGKAAEELMRNP